MRSQQREWRSLSTNFLITHFCRRCETPLDLKLALDVEEKKKEKDELVAMVIERLYEKLNVEKAIQEAIRELKVEEKIEKL